MLASDGTNVTGINYRLIVVRIVTAVSLFAVLGKANVWLDVTTNSVLALGYRTLLLLAPLTLLYFGPKSLSFTTIVAAAALLLLSINLHPATEILAAALFAYGVAVAGYLVKSEAAQTKEGAAYNKIALNVGSLIAGLLLIVPNLNATHFFLGTAAVLLLCVPLTWGLSQSATATPKLNLSRSGWMGQLAWAISGVVIGIKLFAVFSILPQAIIGETGELPDWYGLMLILNSAIVVLLQMPIMRLIERMGRYSLHCIIGTIGMGFVVLAAPGVFNVHMLWGAVIWITLLSIAECSFSYLDYFAARQNGMFIKELSVGIGAGLTVLVMRTLPGTFNTLLISSVGLVGIVAWLLMTKRDAREK
jgi:hypothetical protein